MKLPSCIFFHCCNAKTSFFFFCGEGIRANPKHVSEELVENILHLGTAQQHGWWWHVFCSAQVCMARPVGSPWTPLLTLRWESWRSVGRGQKLRSTRSAMGKGKRNPADEEEGVAWFWTHFNILIHFSLYNVGKTRVNQPFGSGFYHGSCVPTISARNHHVAAGWELDE